MLGLVRRILRAIRHRSFDLAERISVRLLGLLRIQVLRITAIGRIGHLAAEPDLFVKLGILGARAPGRGVIVSPPGAAANEALLECWREHFWIIGDPRVGRYLDRLRRYPGVEFDTSRLVVAIGETAPYIAVQREWGERRPVISLNARIRANGEAWLASRGVSKDDRFVCLHCREGGYSPADEEIHSFRNCNVETYFDAVQALTKRGYWCIRLGDPTMQPMPGMEGLIDYAHASDRQDWLDLYLMANCRFLLGSASGVVQATTVLGRPCAVANQLPLSSLLQFAHHDLAIPKLLWSTRQERYLGFSEVMSSPVSNYRYAKQYHDDGIRVVDNSREEIVALTIEMLERIEGRSCDASADDRDQARFRSYFRPGHYSYGGTNRVGRAFLQKYRSLLGD